MKWLMKMMLCAAVALTSVVSVQLMCEGKSPFAWESERLEKALLKTENWRRAVAFSKKSGQPLQDEKLLSELNNLRESVKKITNDATGENLELLLAFIDKALSATDGSEVVEKYVKASTSTELLGLFYVAQKLETDVDILDLILQTLAKRLKQEGFTKTALEALLGGQEGADAIKEAFAAQCDTRKIMPELIMKTKQGEAVTALALSPDGEYVAVASREPMMKFYRLKDKRVVGSIATDMAVISATFSPDSRFLIAVFEDSKARVYQLLGTKFAELGELQSRDGVSAVTLSADGQYLVSLSTERRTAHVYHLQDDVFEEIGVIPAQGRINSAEFSRNNNYVVTASDDGLVRLYRVQGDKVKEFIVVKNKLPMKFATFSPNGEFLVTGSLDKKARIYRITNDGATEIKVVEHGAAISVTAFSPHSEYVVTASVDGTVRVFQISKDGTLVEIGTIKHEKGVHFAQFSYDGSLVLSASEDGIVKVSRIIIEGGKRKIKEVGVVAHNRLENAATFIAGREFMTVPDDGAAIKLFRISNDKISEDAVIKPGGAFLLPAVALSRDGNYIAFATDDNTAHVYQVQLHNFDTYKELFEYYLKRDNADEKLKMVGEMPMQKMGPRKRIEK